MTLRYRIEVSPGDWRRVRRLDGESVTCEEDCCDQGGEADCVESDPPEFEDCTGTGSTLLECLEGTLAVVELEFADNGGCTWSAANGTYVLGVGNGLGQWTDGGLFDAAFKDALRSSGCALNFGEACSLDDFNFGLIASCDVSGLHISFGTTGQTTDCDGECLASWSAEYTQAFPITLTRGMTFNLIPQNSAVDGGVGDLCPVITSCTLTLYGTFCTGGIPVPCDFPPDPNWYVHRVDIGEEGCETGCTAHIEVVATDGFCDTIYFWSDGNTEGKDRTIINIPTCGTYSYTLYGFDIRGCLISKTIEIECGCECDVFGAPSGSFGIADDGSYTGAGDCIFSLAFFGDPVSGCPYGFYEVCHLNGGIVCPPDLAECGFCEGDSDDIVYNPCTCCVTVGQNVFYTFSELNWEEAQCFRIRFWDRPCGCATPWVYVQYSADCTVDFPQCGPPD